MFEKAYEEYKLRKNLVDEYELDFVDKLTAIFISENYVRERTRQAYKQAGITPEMLKRIKESKHV